MRERQLQRSAPAFFNRALFHEHCADEHAPQCALERWIARNDAIGQRPHRVRKDHGRRLARRQRCGARVEHDEEPVGVV